MGKYAKEESFWSSFSRKACGSARAEPSHQGAKPKCKANYKSETDFSPQKTGAAIIKIPSVDNTNVHALTMCGYIAAPEINGDSSLISRPVRGDLIPQYLGQECRTLEVHITDNWILILGRCFVGLVDGFVFGHWFVSFRPSLRSGRAVKDAVAV